MARVRILSLNINAGFDLSRRRFLLPAMRDALRDVGADVVLLQEVLGAHAGHARRHAQWPLQAQHAYLAEALCPHHAYGRNADFAEGHQGNAVLSRFPIAAHGNHDISIAGHEARGLLHAVIDVPGAAQPLHVVDVHLGLRESHRQWQAAQLVEFVAGHLPATAPLVVAGDFNDWRTRAHPLLRASRLREAFEEISGRLALTFPAPRPVLPLDRIYLRDVDACAASVLRARPWSRLSDHAGLLVEIEM
ncbi:MAG TPA: endonuclease/exonuclease/phosphatase family protein [Luteimonas sp.]|jgi:endonuclease/exonuclease/phosphatase family metal-dependent hydrolase|nr:endonuclease/exonuclease/phosphatase family protein [Luteimonas sp.]